MLAIIIIIIGVVMTSEEAQGLSDPCVSSYPYSKEPS